MRRISIFIFCVLFMAIPVFAQGLGGTIAQGAGSGLDADKLDGEHGVYYTAQTYSENIASSTGPLVYMTYDATNYEVDITTDVSVAGKLGVGVTNPTREFEVAGEMEADAGVFSNENPDLKLEDETVGDDDWRIRADGDVFKIQQRVGDTTWTDRMSIDGSGNITVTQDIIISSRPTCFFSYELHGASRTTVPTGGTYELICGTGTGHADDAWFNYLTDANGNTNKIEFAGPTDKKCLIIIHSSFETSGADEIGVAIYKNGSIIDESAHQHQETSAASKFGSVAVMWRDTLTAGDDIEFYGTTEGGAEMDLYTAQISIQALD